MGTTGGLEGPNPGFGAAVGGTESNLTGPEDDLDQARSDTDDGTPVGEADREADVRRSGADASDAGAGAGAGTGTGMGAVGASDSAMTEDGEPVGEADRDADIERSM
jgi:hypothetical protein